MIDLQQDFTEQVTFILPATVPSGYMQEQTDDMARLVALLSMLCDEPDEFIRQAYNVECQTVCMEARG